MKPPSPPCFKDWQEHGVQAHDAWVKKVGRFRMSVMRYGANWGYLITETTGVSNEVVTGKFDWDWTAMDACSRCEEAIAKLTM